MILKNTKRTKYYQNINNLLTILKSVDKLKITVIIKIIKETKKQSKRKGDTIMKKNTVEEAIEQLKVAILNIEDVDIFTLEQTFIKGYPNYAILAKSIDDIPYYFFLGGYISVNSCIDMYGVDEFCTNICEDIISTFKTERKKQSYVNKDRDEII